MPGIGIRSDAGYEAYGGWSAADLEPPTKVAALTRSGIFVRTNSIPDILDVTRKDTVLQEKDPGLSCGKLCHYVVSVVFSGLSSLLLVIGYTVGGAYLFIYLEQGNEASNCNTLSTAYSALLSSTVSRLVAYSTSGFKNISVLSDYLEQTVNDFAGEFYTLNADPKAVCETLGTPDNPYGWNLLNTVYFTMSIITTIGYGHVYPLTDWGKIITCIYAVLGIPIMLLFLAKIGDVLTRAFLSSYYNFCCMKCYLRSMNYTVWREKERLDKLQEQQADKEVVTEKLQIDHMGGVVVIQEVEEETRHPFDYVDNEEMPQFTVPISVAVLVLVVYMMIGAGLFTVWESSWTLLDAAYFSFITMSTIGFGDMVPGRTLYFYAPGGLTELIVGCIYTIGGLAVLAMCVNLIQETMSEKIEWINKKLGFVSELDELEEQEREEELLEQQMMAAAAEQGDGTAQPPSLLVDRITMAPPYGSAADGEKITGSYIRLKASRSTVALKEPQYGNRNGF